MNKEIEIPEGYEARIEGNKVILEPKESDDERIRKDLITFICQFAPEHLKVQYVAYLERQKEQKPASGNSEKPNNHAEWNETDKLHLNNAILVAKKEWGVNSYTARFLESLRDNYKKCNSHWKPSEEQMKALENVIKCELSAGLHARAEILQTLQNDLKEL